MKKITQNAPGHRPELLCPAGSPLALEAAIEGGADAIYLGGTGFNARMNASNFDADALRSAVRTAHVHGVKVYLALNTLLYDREMQDFLTAAALAQGAGVDAVIVADLGGAALLRSHLPELTLHASTQACAHSAAAGEELCRLGFSRMVVARELSLCDLRATVAASPIEVEAFVHGALCVCHSGQCLFSSMVGGRSGNRGQCAQPCRLPYRTPKGKSEYPLSLKDLSLARHVPDLVDTGVASLKIEGRMRSPEYVLTVSRIWRRLLDENRAANADEMRLLEQAFSRDGFTDGYFTKSIGHGMLGVRSEQDKRDGATIAPFGGLTRRVPLTVRARLTKDEAATLTVEAQGFSYTATGDVPQEARNAPLDRPTVLRQLGKLGSTPFEAVDCRLELDEGIMLPISSLNALRRAAVEGLMQRISGESTPKSIPTLARPAQPTPRLTGKRRSAHMQSVDQLTPTAQDYFDICYLAPEALLSLSAQTLIEYQQKTQLGVALPPVVMEGERESLAAKLRALAARGVRHALVSNPGQLPLVREAGMTAEGDLRLNVTNSETVRVLTELGVCRPILSPELSLPQIRDVAGDVRTAVYGRVPLMLLEKCVIQELADCQACDAHRAELVDRKGARFPVLRLPPHRNIVFNSLPTYMADKQSLLEKYRAGDWHFIFSVERPAQVDRVIDAFCRGTPADVPVRRIGAQG